MTVATEGYANPQFEFCDRIRKIRREIAHMTQEEMAAQLGVTQKTYSAWETGRNHPENIVEIAKQIAFRWRGVTAAWVLGVDDGPEPPTGGGAPVAPLPLDESPLSGSNRGQPAYLVAPRPALTVPIRKAA